MADTYQLMDSATRVGYSIESSNGVDPLAGGAGDRIRWPGPVLNVPTLSEDYMHQDYQPLGSGPDVVFIAKKGEQFEVEVESLVSEDFIGSDEFLSLSLGTIAAGTGLVTPCRPLRTFTLEYGYRKKCGQGQGATFLIAGSPITGDIFNVIMNGITVPITLGTISAPAVDIPDTVEDIVADLVTQIRAVTYDTLAVSNFVVGDVVDEATSSAQGTVIGNLRNGDGTGTLLIYETTPTFTGSDYVLSAAAGSGSTAVSKTVAAGVATVNASPSFTMTSTVAGIPFTLAVSTDSTLGTIAVTDQDYTSWFHKLMGCKVNTVSLTFRPDDLILMRVSIIGRIHVGSQAQTFTDDTEVLDLAVHTLPPAHHIHILYTLQDQGGEAIETLLREFDISWTNNLERIFSDGQNYYASHIMEGNRRFTFNMSMIKQDNDLLEISRGDPSTDAGKLDIDIEIDARVGGAGFYLKIEMAQAVLAERSADLGSDITHVDESFAGLVIGTPVLTMMGS